MLALALRFWKPLAGALLVGTVWAWVLHWGHTQKLEGVRETTVKWQADLAEISKVAQKAAADAKAKDEADAKRNLEIQAGYQAALAANAVDRGNLLGMLKQARAARGSGGAEAPGQPRPVATCPPASDDELDAAVAAALTEGRDNADQLDAVLGQIRPQM